MKNSIRAKHDDLTHTGADALRGLAELQDVEHLLSLQVWFNRNKAALFTNKEGRIVVCDDGSRPIESGELPPFSGISREQALLTAHDAVTRYGKERFGPWNDFEWGMINGKLSAIRWMLGGDWDQLDT